MMYTIINGKKYEIIPFNSFSGKLKCLMFKKSLISDIYLFKRCSMIHTFFMKQNIDICILDRNKRIVYLKSNLGKNKIIIKKGYYTLEMPLGLASKLKLGETIEINEK